MLTEASRERMRNAWTPERRAAQAVTAKTLAARTAHKLIDRTFTPEHRAALVSAQRRRRAAETPVRSGRRASLPERRLIDTLPEPFQMVLRLRDVENLTYAEVAARMHTPLGTVMSRIMRGRRRLAQLNRERIGGVA